jgi:hypothetical protein
VGLNRQAARPGIRVLRPQLHPDNDCMNEAGSVAPQVWQEFSPRDGEQLAVRDDGMIEITDDTGLEGFGIDTDVPFCQYVASMADRIQDVVMESRQQMVPGCPLHPGAHPLQSDVINGAAAWVCPWTKSLVRYMKVTAEAT